MKNWNAEKITLLLNELRALRDNTTEVEIKMTAGGLPENLAQTMCAIYSAIVAT